MSVLLPRNRKTKALLVFCTLLTLVIIVQLLPSDPFIISADEESSETHTELPTGGEAALAPEPLSDYVALLERPLFFPDRKMPPEPEVNATAVIPRSPLRLKLEGVAISADSRVALLRNTLNNELLQLAEGTSHDGWTLDKVSSLSATFRRDDEITEIVLETK